MQASVYHRKISSPWYHRAFSIGVIFATLCVHKLLLPLTDIATFQKEDEKWNPTFEIWNFRFICSVFRYVQKLSRMYRHANRETKQSRNVQRRKRHDETPKYPRNQKILPKKLLGCFLGDSHGVFRFIHKLSRMSRLIVSERYGIRNVDRE